MKKHINVDEVTKHIRENQRFVNRRQIKSTESWKIYEQVQRKMIVYFGEIAVSSISAEMFKGFHDSLAQPHLKANTINIRRRTLRAMWLWLAATDVLVCDISGITEFASVPDTEPLDITDEQLNKIIQRCCLRDAAMLRFAARAGFRRQSLPRFRVDDTLIWQNDDGKFRIAARIPQEKTSRPRVVFAEHDAALLIKSWLTVRAYESEFVFNRLDGSSPISVNTASQIWRNAVIKANLAEALHGSAWHRFRRRYAQVKLRDGHDAAIIADWMGISVQTVLAVYAKRSTERAAAEYFNEAVPDLAKTFFRGN